VLNWILIAVAAIVVVFIAMVALQPADFRVQRSALIAAPTQAVFAQVNDFHNWRAWSPWEKLDPQLRRTYEGPQAGTGRAHRDRPAVHQADDGKQHD
jgi:Polyketide cyclase / dehydrase and lipid transport